MGDSIPRFTEWFGYSAETSAPNANPQWGHLTAVFADEVQRRFEKWLARRDSEQYLRGVRAARDTALSEYEDEIAANGGSDYASGMYDACAEIGNLLR